ncbi:MAG: Asp-tRNA(Asn)/Glu-tRNA(Gln) amidotransferase subunit GatC [Terriglobales bacterium]|jgi:aspartyl-tRNA(Asn)/glutamyl-tRNA(Gln) amidotransferase subunit C
MKVTEKDVAYVAELANLELTGEGRGRLLRDLNSILEYVDRLSELDTSGVEAMAQVAEFHREDETARRKPGDGARDERFGYAARDDVKEGLRASLPHEEAIAGAPETDGTFFLVPKVIER